LKTIKCKIAKNKNQKPKMNRSQQLHYNTASRIKRSILLFLLLLFIWQRVSAQVLFNNYALTGVTIIDANHQNSLPHQTVLITHNIIGAIFNDGSKPISDSFNIMRMEGKYLLPGLIDAHVHVATDPSGTDNREHTLHVLQRMLYSGITSVRDMAGDARTLASLSRDAVTGDIISPDIYYSALMAGPVFFSDPRTASASKGGVAGKMPYMLAVTESTNMVLAIAEAKGTGATGIKLYANLSAPLVNKIVAEANKQGMIVWGHAWLQDAKPSDLVKAGVSPVSHSPLLIYDKLDTIPSYWKNGHTHYNSIGDSVPNLSSLFQLMKEHRTILDATMLAYKSWADEDSTMRYDYELAKRVTALAYKAGVTIDAGTDDDQKEFVQKEMELMVKDAGFTPIDAIVAATLNGAKALHIDNAYGTISTGKIANLLILDKNPLENIENIESVNLVIKNGKVFKKINEGGANIKNDKK
jgi:predicted amidohydrolase YtcJ